MKSFLKHSIKRPIQDLLRALADNRALYPTLNAIEHSIGQSIAVCQFKGMNLDVTNICFSLVALVLYLSLLGGVNYLKAEILIATTFSNPWKFMHGMYKDI